MYRKVARLPQRLRVLRTQLDLLDRLPGRRPTVPTGASENSLSLVTWLDGELLLAASGAPPESGLERLDLPGALDGIRTRTPQDTTDQLFVRLELKASRLSRHERKALRKLVGSRIRSMRKRGAHLVFHEW